MVKSYPNNYTEKEQQKMKTLSQVCSLLVSCLKISLSLLAGKQKLMTESLVKTRQHFFCFQEMFGIQ